MTSESKLHGIPAVRVSLPTARDVAWRAGELIRAGFAVHEADRLAQVPGLDLHAVLDLVDRGCPPGLAVRILATPVAAHG